ncbi:MAG TPA: hypothetical protein VLQ93_24330 [Myxococcaceae bacterium]|nr:hypothetical protein [Myxococcaceae bacterium]
MSRLLPLIVLLLAGAAGAHPVRAGVELGLLMRQEGGGQRSSLLSVGPRAALSLGRYLELSGAYGFSWSAEGTEVRATSQYHRLTLRPELHLPVRSAAFVLAAGPALTVTHTTLSDRDAAVSTRYTRLGLSGGAALDIHLKPLTLRTGMDLVWTAGRLDLLLGVGALFTFGESP